MADKIESQAEELYDAAMQASLKSRSEGAAAKTFTQNEMVELGVVYNVSDLMKLVEQLYRTKVMRYVTREGKVGFQLRSKGIAIKLRTVGSEENMIYEQIEEAGESGLWIKTLKQKTGITVQATLTKAIKSLEHKELIKQIKTVRNPTQKTYILSHFTPGESVTGGPWHADGELDIDLIDTVTEFIVKWIDNTCWSGIKPKRRPVATDGDRTDAGMKRKRSSGDGDIEGVHLRSRRSGESAIGQSQYMWRPAGWEHYPSAAAIFHFVQQSGFVKKQLVEADIMTLLDTLVYSERIEKVGGGYRTIRALNDTNKSLGNMMSGRAGGEIGGESEGNGLTQAPCGRCPVFDLCRPGGPVNAGNCPYFETWLET